MTRRDRWLLAAALAAYVGAIVFAAWVGSTVPPEDLPGPWLPR